MTKNKTKSSNLEEQATYGQTQRKRDDLARKNEQMARRLKQAEAKAREFDINNNTDVGAQFPGIDNEVLGQALQYFYANGLGLHREKDYRLKFRFTQLLQNNWQFLNDHNYLTSEEKVFLLDINPNVAISSNCLVKDVNSKVQEPLNQKEIATILGTSPSKVSRIVKQLIQKGILAKAEIPNKDGSKVITGRSHSLYVNPNIMYSGHKDYVNETLKSMFNNPPELIRYLPDQLFLLLNSSEKQMEWDDFDQTAPTE